MALQDRRCRDRENRRSGGVRRVDPRLADEPARRSLRRFGKRDFHFESSGPCLACGRDAAHRSGDLPAGEGVQRHAGFGADADARDVAVRQSRLHDETAAPLAHGQNRFAGAHDLVRLRHAREHGAVGGCGDPGEGAIEFDAGAFRHRLVAGGLGILYRLAACEALFEQRLQPFDVARRLGGHRRCPARIGVDLAFVEFGEDLALFDAVALVHGDRLHEARNLEGKHALPVRPDDPVGRHVAGAGRGPRFRHHDGYGVVRCAGLAFSGVFAAARKQAPAKRCNQHQTRRNSHYPSLPYLPNSVYLGG